MDSFLLRTVKHHLVDGLSQEALSEAADGVAGVSLIKDLDQVPGLENFQNLDYLSMRFMPKGANVLEDARTEHVADDRSAFQEKDALAMELLFV